MSGKKIYSNLRVQADQKEVIISRLREQLYHLKKNQQEYYLLEDQYRSLEHKYKLLLDQKNIGDGDFKNRKESAIRSITGLKCQSDQLKAELRNRGLEISDLKTDQNTLKSQLDQRTFEIEKLKAELSSLFADVDELTIARASLAETLEKTRFSNATLNEKLNSLCLENESVKRKIDDTEKYFQQLIIQEKALRNKIISYENENNSLDNEISNIIEDIATFDGRIMDAQNQIKKLQADIAESGALCEKYKSQALHYQKTTQSETMKNNDTIKLLSQSQHLLKTRINQCEEGRRQIAALNAETDNLNNINSKLEDDLQFCRKHLENLALMNQDIVLQLEKFSEEDEEVRRLIDRRAHVQRVKGRVEESGILLNRTTASTAIEKSPFKRSTISYY